jgi:hypothetical protein
MLFKVQVVIFCILLSIVSCNTTSDRVLYSSAQDSLMLLKMVHERERGMKEQNMEPVMAQFADDATFINGDGFYLANKKEISEFHYALKKSDSISYHYVAGKVLIRMLDSMNALVYYPNRMDWYRLSNPRDTIEKETRLLTISAQKRKGAWKWIAVTNQQTLNYFDDLAKNKINNIASFWDDSTFNK